MKGKLLFQEKQTFQYTWSWWMLIAITIPLVGLFVVGIFQQLILGEPFGSKPMSDIGLLLVGAFTALLMGGILWFYQRMEIEVIIDHRSISYRFFPFVKTAKVLRKGDVTKMTVRKYRPVMEYGGWGYRSRFSKDSAMTVKGNWGLQLHFTNGKKLLLGTQKPKELEKAIEQLQGSWERE